jgi:ribosomal protein S18 acetylase RimI-like enzyme
MALEIRIATPDDAPVVGQLLYDFNAEFEDYTPGVDVLTERARDFIAREAATFLLIGSPPIGIAELRFRDSLFTGKPVVYLEEFYVAPDERDRGLGKALLERVIELARERDAGGIELGTAVSDEAARHVYESFGFTNEEKPGDPSTRMLYYELEL